MAQSSTVKGPRAQGHKETVINHRNDVKKYSWTTWHGAKKSPPEDKTPESDWGRYVAQQYAPQRNVRNRTNRTVNWLPCAQVSKDNGPAIMETQTNTPTTRTSTVA